jgi:HTH-type transcriptional repressor of NAD biosynthesis genes
MNNLYKYGLVVGKFSPLHHGHEHLIKTAQHFCDHLIIISYTNPLLGFSDQTRYMWLKNMYPDAVVIVPESKDCPHNDADGDIHRAFCAKLIEERTTVRPDAVFTSEDYGDGFARFLSDHWDTDHWIEHQYVDDHYRFEGNLPIALSATYLREHPEAWEKHISEFVRKTRTKRLCLLGGESSGKTTLADALSKASGNHFWVAEYGRKFCEEIGGVANLKYEDLLTIGKEQVKIEDYVVNSVAQQWVICDTSPLVTRFYSEKLYGRVDPELEELSKRKYDMYFVLGMSHGWHQDGDRMSPEFSMEQELWYWRQMSVLGESTRVVFIDGPLESRLKTALNLLENYNDN